MKKRARWLPAIGRLFCRLQKRRTVKAIPKRRKRRTVPGNPGVYASRRAILRHKSFGFYKGR